MTDIDALANDMHASHLEPNASCEVPMKFPATELLNLVSMPHLECPSMSKSGRSRIQTIIIL